MEEADVRKAESVPDAILESSLDRLIQEGTPMQAIQKLRATTGLPLRDAKTWVSERRSAMNERERKPCPFCGKPLRTDKAMLRVWHGLA
jgi:hypothetical protein